MNLETASPVAPAIKSRYFWILLFGAACIAFAPIFVRLSPVAPTMTAFWRVSLAFALLLPLNHGAATATPRRLRGRQRLWLFFPGLFFALDLAFWHWSIHFTSVANSTLLANLAPIFVTAAAAVLFRERITPLFLAGLAMALAGTLVLVGYSFTLSPQALLGDGLGICTAVCYAAYQLSIKQLRNRTPTLQLMTGTCLSAGLVLAPISLLLGETIFPDPALGWAAWVPLFGLAIVSQCFGQGVIAFSMAHLPAALSSVSLLVQPVIATVAAYLLLGESIGAMAIAGGMIVLSGVWIARIAAERTPPRN